MAAFTITAEEWGNGGHPFSVLTVRFGDERCEFRGDAYWQWAATPDRNHGKGFCWSQALHDALEGWHACILHTGDDCVVHDRHPDFPAILDLWNRARDY